MGMSVLYYDVIPIMPLGSAKQIESFETFLGSVDFLSLHVPELPETTNLISGPQFALMKDGAYLLNNARGKVIDIPELVKALKSGKLAGAAVDVFPSEPGANGPNFGDDLNAWSSELRSCDNLILTPHIGGSTEEAQSMIGAEVGSALVRYINYGSTIGALWLFDTLSAAYLHCFSHRCRQLPRRYVFVSSEEQFAVGSGLADPVLFFLLPQSLSDRFSTTEQFVCVMSTSTNPVCSNSSTLSCPSSTLRSRAPTPRYATFLDSNKLHPIPLHLF